MRKSLFQKANYFLTNTLVEVLNEEENSIRLRVGNFEVDIRYKKLDLFFWCNCRSGAFNKTCSHTIAAMTFLSNEANN